jgi:large repetitive protein
MAALRSALTLSILLCACSRGGTGNPDDPDASDDPDDPDASVNPGDPDGGGEPSSVVVCDDPVPAPASGACEVSGSGSALLLRGTVLGDGTVYEHGSVLIDGGEITCVGCDCSAAGAKVIACAGQVISPGLINAHEHLTFSEGWPIAHGSARYDHRHDWRDDFSTPSNPHGTSGNRWVEVRAMLAGTTSVVGSGGTSGGVRNLDQTEASDEDLGVQEIANKTFPLGDSNGTFHANCAWNYAYTELEGAEFHNYNLHVAEGITNYAAEEFRCESTSMVGGQDYTEPNTAHVHGIGLQAADYWNMARDKTALVWSPRSNIDLYGMTAQVALFARLGGNLALGTDWTYGGSANLLRELVCADAWNRDRLDGYFTDEQLWQMVTGNAAAATGVADRLGVLKPGAIADISVFAAEPGEYHRAVITADNRDVLLVLKAGAPLLGEPAVVTGLGGSGCSAIDVCGDTRSICLGTWGTYDALATAVNGAYPALFCGTPEDEPTCVPSRPTAYTGALTATDGDGDGLADGSDNCPAVFNPIRPIDGGNQPDDDGDGTGDACDATPLAIDLDGDTVANTADNCPFTSNGNQADGDGDDKGDACDACPELANPDSLCSFSPPEATIAGVQTGDEPAGTTVTIKGVVVTGKNNLEIWVQDPAGGTTNSGLRVFKGSNPNVVVGDKVDVSGVVKEYYEETELDDATITKVGTATAIVPVDLTLAQAMGEQYEGVLVRITDADMGVSSYDCSVDDSNCTDTDLWTVTSTDGTMIVYKRLYTGSDWSTQVGDTTVTGVMTWRYGRRRIQPRTAADFNP